MSAAEARPGATSAIVPDHLVVAARTLADGVAWCEATLGVVPTSGGSHPTMGTHNRVLAVGGAQFPHTYLEIIAIDPASPPPLRPRWFELDEPAVQRAIASAPRLLHWVARTADIEAGLLALRRAGHELGSAHAAERATPTGVLRWRIALREDGRRPAAGAVPLLIEWGPVHPCDALPACGVALERIAIGGVAATLAATLGVSAGGAGAPALCVALATPHGPVALTAL